MLNSNVQWNGQDDQGAFHHVGKCVAVNEFTLVLATTHYGEMEVPTDECVKTRAARTKRVEDTPEPQSVPTVRPGSKAEQVLELVSNNMDATRKEAIAMIIEQIGMGEAGASTYYSNAKKRLTS